MRQIPRDEALALADKMAFMLSNPDGMPQRDLVADAYTLATYVRQPLPEPPPPFPGVGVPLAEPVLKELGFRRATEAEAVYCATDADGRELKYTLLGDEGKPTVTFIDDEGGAAFLPVPADKAGVVMLLKALMFQPV